MRPPCPARCRCRCRWTRGPLLERFQQLPMALLLLGNLSLLRLMVEDRFKRDPPRLELVGGGKRPLKCRESARSISIGAMFSRFGRICTRRAHARA